MINNNIQPIRKESQKLAEILERNHIVILDITPDFSTEEIRKTKKYSLVKAKEIYADFIFSAQICKNCEL